MPVIATAGHVDHGKSTLVLALTGRDPDRWEEEKRRGLTIDLGFSWTDLGGRPVGFVDVPGHERFVKNMLAGVDGADAALFVVAADEGWKPQSEEHLAVLDLIGIDRGVVALTRADLVDEDRLELATLEVAERLEGTILEGIPIVPTAAPTGGGIDPLRDALAAAIDGVDDDDHGRPRLWIDRAFTIGGAGTIVTGTLTGGSIAVGDALDVLPAGHRARVRSIQVHERDVERAAPGARTAVNLSGVERADLGRGMMLGTPDQWRPTSRFLAALRPVRGLDASDRGSHHIHAGSGAWTGRVRTLADDGRWIAVIDTDGPVPVAAGDHIVIREVGRQAVVAGGEVVDPHPPARSRDVRARLHAFADAAADPDARAARLLDARGVARFADLASDSGGGRPAGVVAAGAIAMSDAAHADLSARASRAASRFHEHHPFRPGVPVATMARELGVDPELFEVIAGSLDGLASDGATIRLTSHRPDAAADAAPGWEAARTRLLEAGPAPPATKDLGVDSDALATLLRSGALVAVGSGLAYLPETLEDIIATTKALEDGFTVAEFRDALGITRKHAIPLLEWLDERGVTRREGDGRIVRR